MVRYKSLNYRTLDELMDSVATDLRIYYSDGTLEIGELIKMVHKVNYELGLQITKTKETVLDVEHNRTKLPADFYFLNFAFLCHKYHSVTPSIGNGLIKEEVIVPVPPVPGPELTTCPCLEVVSLGVQAKVTYCDGTNAAIFFPPGTSSLCAQKIEPSNPAMLTYSTDHNCWKELDGSLNCQGPVIDCGCGTPSVCDCEKIDTDPWKQNTVRTMCNDQIQINIVEKKNFEVRHYTHTEPLFIQPSSQASAFSSYDAFRLHGNTATIKNGFLETAKECGKVYINYQGIMEDDDGNLLVLDHPLINEYYEYTLKKRVLENMYINGEPDIERRLQYVDKQLTIAKHQALMVAYTPDFAVMKSTFQLMRKQEYENHFAPFNRFYGSHKLSIWFDKFFNSRYRD